MARTNQPGARPQPEVGDTPDAADYSASAGAGTDSLVLLAGTHAFGSASVTLGTIPAGAAVVMAWVEVTQAYNAASTNVLTVGYVGSTSAYLAAADVTEGTPGVYPVGGKGPFASEAAERTAVVAFAQTGTPATTGASKAYLLVRLP